ncbi:MAG: hypothetical protein ACK5MN_10695 [Lachnospiraceae bacterium]
MRIWSKLFKDTRLVNDTVITDDTTDTRTQKVLHALEATCYELDLGNPIWLDSTIREFQRHAKTRFYQDSFVEQIDFDYMEFEVIEE